MIRKAAGLKKIYCTMISGPVTGEQADGRRLEMVEISGEEEVTILKKYGLALQRWAIALSLFAVLILGIQAPAQAALTLKLDDTLGNVISVVDGDLNDENSTAGVVTFIGALGVWNVNVSTGISENTAGKLYMDLNSIDRSSGAGTLKISLTDTVVPSSPVPYTLSVGGTTAGTLSVVSPAAMGPFSSGAFSGSTTGTFSSSEAVLMTQITHSGKGVTSFDAEMSAVPIPAAFWLLGSGLVGLIGIKRRCGKQDC